RASSHLTEPPLEPDVDGMARYIARNFAVAIELYVRLTRKIAESNWDLTKGKGANYLWDLQVAFLVGPNHTFQDRPAVVVTSDKAIRKAAEAGGVADLILDYGMYRQSLDSD